MIERIEINLLPAEYRIHRRNLHVPREVVYPLLLMILTGFGLFFFSIKMRNDINQYNNEIAQIEQKILQNKPIQNEIRRLGQDKRAIQEKIIALERINVNREKWVRLMEVLSQKLPDFTWLVSVREEDKTPPSLHIEGRTYSFPEVANYMSRLKESIYVSGVDLSNIEQIDPQEKIFRFIITCRINQDAGLNDRRITGAGQ
jgi:Tfp pilus assembly protein PilN